MPKRRLILGILILGILAATALVALTRPQEPSYNGQPLSAWILRLCNPDSPKSKEDATLAVRHIGTNAVPHLLRWLQRPPSWELRIQNLAEDLPKSLVPTWALPDRNRQMQLYVGTEAAFQVLGSEAATAIPCLTRSLNAPTNQPAPIPTVAAACALAAIGPQGLPPLMAAVTNRQYETRFAALVAISTMKGTVRPAMPALVQLLDDPRPEIREVITNALRAIAPEIFTNTLRSIGCEALLNASPK